MQQITRGDYLKDLITIYIDNNLQTSLTDLYTQFVFQCGDIQKFLTPAQVIKISFNDQESQLLKNINTCYLAGITAEGHKETFNGSLTFNTRGEVVFYEPPVSTVIPAATESNCDCRGINGFFSNCSQSAIKAYFSLNYAPTKLSELINDTDFQDSVQVAETVSIHNASTEAHPYIQSVIASATEALTVSIQAETTAREEAVSLAISTTEAYADSIVTQATEATRAYADSIVSSATTATEAYTDSVLQSATTAINTTIGYLDNLDTSVKSSVVNAINSEVSARENADNNLQGQIDGLAAASDVTDIVGTYQELQNYDTQHLNDNDIIKVLSDSTHDDQPSYYRFDKDTDTFSYIGSESAAYTKAQSDSIFVTQTTEINGHALSSDINLTPSDIGALADTYATVISANTSAIASNTSVIAQHTTAIASNTSDISTINGKIPTDASSSNKLVSASTLAASIANLANQDLSNLTSNGEARLHALKGYSDLGELLTDAKGLADLKDYAHSTFDKSKFTVVGSPVITDDGIASGFSSSNYLLTPTIDFRNANSFEIISPVFSAGTLSGNQEIMGVLDVDNQNGGFWIIITDSKIYMQITFTDWSDNIASQMQTLTANTKYQAKITYTGSAYEFYYREENGEWISLGSTASALKLSLLNHTIGIGKDAVQNAYFANGTVDLKQCSIIIDKIPVFSGNKTGIDTIKPDNYTVVGSPTISADGIASGFSTSSYLTINDYISGSSNWIMEFEGTLPVSGEYNTNIFGFNYSTTSNSNIFLGRANEQDDIYFDVIVDVNGTPTSVSGGAHVNMTGYANAHYKGFVSFNGTQYIASFTFDDGVTKTISINSTYLLANTGNLIIGYSRSVSTKFNLNAFKIYVDGNLVYQPCLKIPYTESKTGSKTVDSIYRDRVSDMADQFGYANYYTLDEDNGNFTLPMGELYGLIGQRTLRDSYRNGINYWELYSNRDLEQGGSCTSGVEVTFARPFADTNYVLSVPYSAKSSTAFTPTQTGDWIAKGKGLL